MFPDKDDWADVDEWKTAHDTGNVDFASDVIDGQAKYKESTPSMTVESGEVYMTVDYKSQDDYNSSVADYQTARDAAGIDRRTRQDVVSAEEV